jgi:hypothetical protein
MGEAGYYYLGWMLFVALARVSGVIERLIFGYVFGPGLDLGAVIVLPIV